MTEYTIELADQDGIIRLTRQDLLNVSVRRTHIDRRPLKRPSSFYSVARAQ